MSPENKSGQGSDEARVNRSTTPRLDQFIAGLTLVTGEEFRDYFQTGAEKREAVTDLGLIKRIEKTDFAISLATLIRNSKDIPWLYNAQPKDFSSTEPFAKKELAESDPDLIEAFKKGIEDGNMRVIAAKAMADVSENTFMSILMGPLTAIAEPGKPIKIVDGQKIAGDLLFRSMSSMDVVNQLREEGISVEPTFSWEELLQQEGYLEKPKGGDSNRK